jgi:hypothetical protein
LEEAAQYADVNGVILSGFSHQPNTADVGIFSTFYPAQLDPKFASAGLDSGYLTTLPGTRGEDFYNTAFADPTVIATDETLKSTGTESELTTGNAAFLPTVSQQIVVPVLEVLGEDDSSFCNPDIGLSCADDEAIIAREAADFAPQACLEAYVLPKSGHDVNLHPDAHKWFHRASHWIARRVGRSMSQPPTHPCQ